MKKIGLLIAISCCCLVGFAQNTVFKINGTIEGRNEGYIYISYTEKDGKYKLDSALVHDHAFVFKGEVDGPSIVYLRSSLKSRNMDDPNSASFFIEPTNMELALMEGAYKDFKLLGSKTEEDNKRLNLSKASIKAEMKPISEAYTKANAAYTKAIKDNLPQTEQDILHKRAGDIREQFEPFNARMDQIDYAFFLKNPDSYLTAYLMIFKVSGLSLDSAQLFYNNMTPRVQQSVYGKMIAEEIVKIKKGSPGAIATIFTATGIDGKALSLADFKGKYILLDFWASWCLPCRAGNPHLKKIYAQYQSKGFEIIGISDDDSKPEAWKNAVKQDGIGIWKHVLRGLKWNGDSFDRTNDISENFGIHTLPTKILIDKEGKIIGRYGGGAESDEAMDKKLATIFGK